MEILKTSLLLERNRLDFCRIWIRAARLVVNLQRFASRAASRRQVDKKDKSTRSLGAADWVSRALTMMDGVETSSGDAEVKKRTAAEEEEQDGERRRCRRPSILRTGSDQMSRPHLIPGH